MPSIIFISGQSNQIDVAKAFRAGAVNFLFKPFGIEELLTAVREALQENNKRLIKNDLQATTNKLLETLTPREKEILNLLLKGLTNKDIATHIGKTDATVKIHKSRVLKKMGVRTLPELISQYHFLVLDSH